MGKLEFGSREWIEQVFASGDARSVAGRSRPTQRWAIASSNGKANYAEGGNEATARALMLLGQNAGQVRRWKLQPFEMTEAEHGVKAYPDLIFEMWNRRVYVAEARSARYQTAEKLQKARQIEDAINTTRTMQYLYWTDAWPLVPATAALVRELRKCGTSDIPKADIHRLRANLEAGAKTFYELRETGWYRDVVMAAVWKGYAHIDLTAAVTDSTKVTTSVKTRGFEELLHLTTAGQTWWGSLAKA